MANKPNCAGCSAYKYCDTVVSSTILCNYKENDSTNNKNNKNNGNN